MLLWYFILLLRNFILELLHNIKNYLWINTPWNHWKIRKKSQIIFWTNSSKNSWEINWRITESSQKKIKKTSYITLKSLEKTSEKTSRKIKKKIFQRKVFEKILNVISFCLLRNFIKILLHNVERGIVEKYGRINRRFFGRLLQEIP